MSDLKKLTDADLAALLKLFRELATSTKNRVVLDLYIIIEGEGVRRHKSTPIAEYQDNELVEIIQALTEFVDDLRAKGVPDNQPGMHFVLENLTTLIEEAKRRGLIPAVH